MHAFLRTSVNFIRNGLFADGGVQIKRNQAGGAGGGVYTSSRLNFTNWLGTNASSIDSNNASFGGGIMGSGHLAGILLSSGYQLNLTNNSAQQDGGGIGMTGGSLLHIEDEACAAACKAGMRGNNICDLPCMTRGCNW